MNPKEVILIFDIGKTNKKLFLFDQTYSLVLEKSKQFTEIVDDDGFACEDINALSTWILDSIATIQLNTTYIIKAIHYASYGASFVYLDASGHIMAPLYNYLKPFKEPTKKSFENKYGSLEKISLDTASPFLGNLNSGLQLYALKNEKPEIFKKIKWALHLPQYIHYLITGELSTDITSIGCHTMLWDFIHQSYHAWVKEEGLDKLFPPLKDANGLHDSSAALIPYLSSFQEPFILISTGTWSISLNPFNFDALTENEMKQDVLFYLSYTGRPVKASRLFIGREHERGIEKLNSYFHKPAKYYTSVKFNASILLNNNFNIEDLSSYSDYETAYHNLVAMLVQKQIISTNLILSNCSVKRIFVDGGFSQNEIFMHLLAVSYSYNEIFAATIPQASSLGAALAVHKKWNSHTLPHNLISLKFYAKKIL